MKHNIWPTLLPLLPLLQRTLQSSTSAARTIVTTACNNIADILLLAGSAHIAYGTWLIYPPAGYISAGTLLLAGGVLAARGGK